MVAATFFRAETGVCLVVERPVALDEQPLQLFAAFRPLAFSLPSLVFLDLVGQLVIVLSTFVPVSHRDLVLWDTVADRCR